MSPKNYALFGGALMVILGALAFVPNLNQAPLEAGLPSLLVENSYGFFLGLFAMNIFNKAAMIVIGLWGIAASRAPTTSLPRSVQWSRWVFGILGVLAVLGAIPQTNTLYGYVPLFGAMIGLHAVFAVLGAYFGFALTAKAHKENESLRRGDRDNIRVA